MQLNVQTLNILIYYYLFIYLFIFRFLLDVTNSHFFGYLFMLTQKKQKNKNKKQTKPVQKYTYFIKIWTPDTLSDFNNYIKFYIIMSASHEFTIFVFSIYWKGTEKLSAIHTQSLITRSCYIQTMDKSIRTLPIYTIYLI
jgi:hypothetical protein